MAIKLSFRILWIKKPWIRVCYPGSFITQKVQQSFSMLDSMPLPCFVVEVKSKENAIICYCNEKCMEIGFFPSNDVIENPFYEIMNEKEKEWSTLFDSVLKKKMKSFKIIKEKIHSLIQFNVLNQHLTFVHAY